MHCILQSKHIVIRSCEHIFGCLEPMTVHEVKPDKYCLLLKLHFQSRDKLEMEKATLHVTFFSLNLETSGDTCIIFTKKNAVEVILPSAVMTVDTGRRGNSLKQDRNKIDRLKGQCVTRFDRDMVVFNNYRTV